MSTNEQLAQALREFDAARKDLISDLRDVFDATGAETPQVVRDLIEYADSALQVTIGRMNDKAQAAHEAEKAESLTPFAWATFDGEGSYDLRLYEDNEDYRDKFIERNTEQFASWVLPLHHHHAPAAPVAVPRTDREIVEQTEVLADMLMSWAHRRVKSDPLLNYRDSQDTRARQCWMMACEIQEFLTCTDAQNAAQELEGGEA